MPKQKSAPGVQNRHVYTRASYLYQVATYLATQDGSHQPQHSTNDTKTKTKPLTEEQQKTIQNMSRKVAADMRAVSLKAQIRQTPAVKRTICKFCDTLQMEGKTCHSVVENQSKGARKPWADVLAMTCLTCGNVKRYPVSAPRQKRRQHRRTDIDGNEMDLDMSQEPDGKPDG